MVRDLVFEPTVDGLLVRLVGVAVPDWLSASDENAFRLSPFVRLREEEGAVQASADTLRVPWDGVATLSWEELRRSGMPRPSPFSLQVESTGSIAQPDFGFEYWYTDNGRHVLVRRQGAWLTVGERHFTLLDPMYTVVEALDQYDPQAMTDIEDRMKWWGNLSTLMPEDVVVDQHLRSLRVVVVATFRLEPFRNSVGELDFDPIPGGYVDADDGMGSGERRFTELLEDERLESFRRYFRLWDQARQRYPVGDGTYVFLTTQAVRALNVVRHAQGGTEDDRRAFLKTPHSYLRNAVADEESDNDFSIDDVFADHGLSERVAGIGVWSDKSLPWMPRPAQPWLPPEEPGVVIGGTSLPITVDQLPELLDRMKKAAKSGVSVIDVGDVQLDVTETTIADIRGLIAEHEVVVPDADCSDDEKESGSDHVLKIIDNLENLEWRPQKGSRGTGLSAYRPQLLSTLLAHQEDGIQWLIRHWESGSWGALLADDMGLGKTLQAMAFLWSIRALMRKGRHKHLPMLVVAPTGLLKNWEDEHKKHLVGQGLGELVRGYGRWMRQLRQNVASSRELASGQPVLDIDRLRSADWVLTTYETLRDYQHSFGYVRWGVGVFDEAQKIKNPSTKMTEAALAMNIDFSLLMTGTPVENRPADIWSILDRCHPGAFGPLKTFSRQYERDDTDREALRDLHARLTSRADQAVTPPVMLRRLKEDHISDLPPKEVVRLPMDMPDMQAAAYARVVYDSRKGVSPLQTLQQLRNISLHPGMPEEDEGIERYIAQSARLVSAFSVLEGVYSRGEKALVFVESRQMQGFLLAAIRRKFAMPEDIMVINGAVSGQARKARVDRFQARTGFDVMLLSPRAGGVGLTLTAANHVIHLSRWWNPAVEDQCTDRTHRIGQLKPVRVYLPLARHPDFGEYSFDLRLDQLMERKRAMNREVLAPIATSKDDMDRLLLDTTEGARQHASVSGDTMERGQSETEGASPPTGVPFGELDGQSVPEDVSIMEPEQFERWVLELLRAVGYDARATRRTGDRGADLIAYSPDRSWTLVVQCKHTQGRRPCGPEAVLEVRRSVGAYELRGEARLAVVTNAASFSSKAHRVAKRHDVLLLNVRDRDSFRRALSALKG